MVAQPVPEVPEVESEYSPALTANTAVSRVFSRDLPNYRYPFRTELYVDNTRGTGVVTLDIYAGLGLFQRKVGVGGTLEFKNQGPIFAYNLQSTATESAGVVKVFENGGLNVGV